MYQAGYPQFDVTATYDSAQHALTLAVKQTQPDTLKADSTGLRFTVPASFRMPLVVRVGTASGDVVQRFEITAREQTVTVAGVPSAPTMVVFDDGNAVLKTLHFEQPTAWLATQLRRDGDLWNRQWVIGQLAGRTGDTAAVAALADAAAHADWYLTRVQALDALGRAPAAAALPAAEAALADTSAAVRAAALGALGRLGGEGGGRAAALARSAFANDPSYAVRAAAVRTLVQADSANARAAITAALAEPSYQDAIQNAALSAIAMTNDTTFIGALDQLMGGGSGQTPAFVLARLVVGGSAHAEAALTKRLGDERAVVRRWALRAFQLAMPRPLALERLRGAVDGLTRADAKQAVRDAIRALEAQGGR